MNDVFICDAIRTPVGKYGGSLSAIRADDLAAIPLKILLERNDQIDPSAFDDVIMGCANQAGEDNRNIARMALLLAGMPESVPGVTINRLCSSGMEAIGLAARAIKAGEAELMIAGGAENMSRSPLVMPKATQAFSRNTEIYDSTIGWRFVNDKFQKKYGTDPLICTAENLATEFRISREDQDRFAHNSQLKTAEAQQNGALAREIIPVSIPQPKGDPVIFEKDEHPRLTSLEKLASLNPVYGPGTTVTAGNASGINDGAAAVIVASEAAIKKFNLTPKARILGTQAAGVPPRTMGIGPVPATYKLLKRLGMTLDQMGIIELNEAFAAQSLACIREFGMADDDPRLNPLGGAIALGHPLGMSGARLVTTAIYQLQNSNSKYALCTMCVGVGQGVSMILEKV
ncbi:3-oxoadipyl-CoA thiolase [Draconibacterium sp. IB214405]|uniref:3-oxoadipyl-CoA thiolase n=1 Tax=Draconibacterium sp. IB214405 TaxID=3097352 RepID=UPI002A0F07FD|nr:3-oxoadipyl-CoA thiolase [Draconibacterium sp. IB214405]MDX8341240.1 3-oxoadipyl-CoA thiolase [Draconibacterium sp. IB214405]